MSITYTWNCYTVDVHPTESISGSLYNDVVYNIHWRVTGETSSIDPSTSSSYQSTNIGTQVLNTSSITDFISFNELTNSQVTTWTQNAMNAETSGSVDAIYSNIKSSIEDKMNPTSVVMTLEN